MKDATTMPKLIAGLNDTLYEIFTWLVLLPKTFFRVVLHPKWIAPFIEGEEAKEATSRYDAYVHPMLFFASVGVVPVLMLIPRIADSDKIVLQNWSRLSFESQLFTVAVFLALWPVASAAWVQRVRGGSISRTDLRPLLYCQAYCWAPMYLMGILFFVIGLKASDLDVFWQVMLSLPPGLYVYWFIYSQVCIIREQAGVGGLRALWILFGIFLVGSFLMLVDEILLLLGLLAVSVAK